MLCVGLTGGIGCGKSTVADLFARHGAHIIDTDAIARQLTQPGGGAIAQIRSAFGEEYLDRGGAVDRAKMRTLVFSDNAARERLESILHPLILEQTRAALRHISAAPYVIVVVPLLAKSKTFKDLIQRVLVVDCNEDTQTARVVERNQMNAREVRAIMAQQTSRKDQLRIADDVIRNDAGFERLTEQVELLHARYTAGQNNI